VLDDNEPDFEARPIVPPQDVEFGALGIEEKYVDDRRCAVLGEKGRQADRLPDRIRVRTSVAIPVIAETTHYAREFRVVV
jgi:hypothetical protein